MIPHNMSGQRIGLLGLGRSGIAAARSLAAAGAVTYAYDDKAHSDIPSGCTADNFIWQDWQDWSWETLDALVISPGIPHLHPKPHPAAAKATSMGVPIISEVELALRAKSDARLIAITGTNGKSTCTALLPIVWPRLAPRLPLEAISEMRPVRWKIRAPTVISFSNYHPISLKPHRLWHLILALC